MLNISNLKKTLKVISRNPIHPHLVESEELGMRFSNTCYADNSFYSEWQRLKGLPEEL